MRTLVAGGAGFIGSHVVDALVDDGRDVIVIDSLDERVHDGLPGYLNPRADYVFKDLRGCSRSELADLESIVHLAALGGVARAADEPANLVHANVLGTMRLVEAAREGHLRSFVHISSFSVYGSAYRYRCLRCGTERGGHRSRQDLLDGVYDVLCGRCNVEAEIIALDESALPDPSELYGASKYMQELCYAGLDLPVHILRLSSVYGERLRVTGGEPTIVARLAGSIAAGVPPTLYEDGRQIRDWVYVGDVVDAVRATLSGASESSSVLNVCTGQSTTLIEAAQLIASAIGRDVQPEIVGGFREGDMRHCLGDPTGLEALLGRRTVPFSDGVHLAFSNLARTV